MQYISSRNMSISAPKIHKVLDSPIDNTPWMQQSSSNTDGYYSSSSNNNNNMMTDNEPDVYMSDTKSNRSRNSTSDMCVEKNTEGKPPYSYATLIKYAIERSSENKLTLSQIYQWVIDHYPYYGSAGSGWKNSIRHNLSLNKSFVRVPRPVNEPGKGSYWTVDQYAVDTEQRVRTNVRGRSNRSSSDSSLHRNNNGGTDPWLLGVNNRNFRDGRSLSTDAGVTSSASALRRTSQYGYCGHPYGGFERNFNNQPQYSYNYHTYNQQQRMPPHETLLSARQHSSVTYSLPASATNVHHHSQSTPFTSSGYSTTNNNNIYSSINTQQQQQSFYSHRQSCPDLTNIPAATYSETNSILPNFNTTGNEVSCLEPTSNIYSPTHHHGFTTPNSYSTENNSKSPIKGGKTATGEPIMSSFFKENNKTAGLPSPVLSPSNCSSTTSSQHLSVVDPLSVVTQHPSPVTTTTTAATTALTASTPGKNNKLKSPYHLAVQQRNNSSNNSVVEECLTSPSSPLVMTTSSPMSASGGGVRSPVPFCMDSVAYMDMVSQQHQQQNNAASSMDDRSLSSSSEHDVCSPQPSMEYSQMISNNKTSSFLSQQNY